MDLRFAAKIGSSQDGRSTRTNDWYGKTLWFLWFEHLQNASTNSGAKIQGNKHLQNLWGNCRWSVMSKYASSPNCLRLLSPFLNDRSNEPVSESSNIVWHASVNDRQPPADTHFTIAELQQFFSTSRKNWHNTTTQFAPASCKWQGIMAIPHLQTDINMEHHTLTFGLLLTRSPCELPIVLEKYILIV